MKRHHCAVHPSVPPEKGRAMDGRRAYRCRICETVWTEGMQGRGKRYSSQRPGYQFANTGAAVGDSLVAEKEGCA